MSCFGQIILTNLVMCSCLIQLREEVDAYAKIISLVLLPSSVKQGESQRRICWRWYSLRRTLLKPKTWFNWSWWGILDKITWRTVQRRSWGYSMMNASFVVRAPGQHAGYNTVAISLSASSALTFSMLRIMGLLRVPFYWYFLFSCVCLCSSIIMPLYSPFRRVLGIVAFCIP